MKNNFVASLSIILISIFFALLFLWPSLPHLTTQFIGDGGDNYEYASYMGYAAQEISDGRFPLTHMNFWRYPVGIDFQRSFDSYLTLSIGTFWTLLVHLPLSYNLTILTILVLNGICSYILFSSISKSRLLGLLGMVMYGFAFYPLAKANAHINLLFIGGFPLFIYFILRLYATHQPRLRDFLFVFLSILLVAIGSLQYLVMLFLFSIISGLLVFFFYRSLWDSALHKVKMHLFSAIQAGVIAGLLFLFLFSAQLWAMLNGTFQFGTREGTLYNSTPALENFFLPNTYLDLVSTSIAPSHALPSIESMVFLGWVEIVLFLLFLTTTHIQKRFRIFIGSLFLIFFVLALGYGRDNDFFLLPYRFLGQLPIFKIIAEPGRYFVIFYLILTTAIVLFLKHTSRSLRFPLYAIPLLFLLLVTIERIPKSIKLVETLRHEPYVSVVAKTSGKAVLDLPVNIYYPRYNVLSLFYQKPIVNGYFHWSGDGPMEKSYVQNSGLLERYSCNGTAPLEAYDIYTTLEKEEDDILLASLKEHGISTLVIHKDDKFFHQVCKNVRLRLSRLVPYEHVLPETEISKEIVAKAWDGAPSFTFYFPKDGIFWLDSMYISPSSPAFFTITNSDGKELEYTWNPVGSPNAFEIQPKYTIRVQVSAGSTVTFSSPDEVADTFFSMWYHYTVFADAKNKPYKPAIQRVFENDTAVVYTL